MLSMVLSLLVMIAILVLTVLPATCIAYYFEKKREKGMIDRYGYALGLAGALLYAFLVVLGWMYFFSLFSSPVPSQAVSGPMENSIIIYLTFERYA